MVNITGRVHSTRFQRTGAAVIAERAIAEIGSLMSGSRPGAPAEAPLPRKAGRKLRDGSH